MMDHDRRLRVGIAGPVSLDLLDYPEGLPAGLPEGYPAPIVSHFANALLHRGHDLVVFTGSRGLQEPMVVNQGRLVLCVVPRYRPRSALSFYARERRWLRSLMNHYPCDLIHAMWSYEYALAALQCGKPALVHLHDHAWTILKHSPDSYRFLRWLLGEYVTLRADNLAANSAYLKRAFGRRGRRMEVIPNFLPRSITEMQPAPLAERNGAIVTISNGFRGRKNVAAALHAWASIRETGLASNYRLLGMGMGPGEEAQAYALRNDLCEGVTFVGTVPFDRALEEIRSSSLLLHPALEESFGMTILEAMAAGTPAVAGHESGNVPDLLSQGECGYLCNVRDTVDIERKIFAALTQKEETQARITSARHRVEEEYSENRVMERLERFYERMLHQTDPSAIGLDA
jgi:glycosyltransferase involved in cell wall biosynthesis